MANVTIKDVAEAAGVSISTVSRYIKDAKSINPISAVKVGQAIKQLNYVPSTFAQNLKRGHSNTIGVIVPDLTPYFSQVCVALNQFFYENKYLLIVCDTGFDPAKERFYLRSLLQQRVAGIIIASTEKNDGILSDYTKGFPNMVYCDRDNVHEYYKSVGEDTIEGAYKLTKHMLEQNNKNVAFYYNPLQYKSNERRLESSMQAVKDLGLNEKDITVVTDLITHDRIYRAVKNFLNDAAEDKTIICFNPIITEGVTMALNALDAKIGKDVMLAGFTLDDYSSKYRYNIPRYIQSPYDMGLKAGEVLLKLLQKPNQAIQEPKLYLLKNEIVV